MSASSSNTDRPFPAGMQMRFTLAYLALFLPFGVATPYLQVLLDACGLDGVGIGLTQGTLDLMGVVAPPLWGVLADRYRRPRAMLLAAVLLAIPSFWLFRVAGTPGVAMAVAAVFGLCYRPLIPMTDGITFRYTRTFGGDYGAVRTGGSVAFMATAVLVGQLGAGWILPCMTVALLLHAASLLLLPPDRTWLRPESAPEPAPGPVPEVECAYQPLAADALPEAGMVSGPMVEPLPDTEEAYHVPVVRSRSFEAAPSPLAAPTPTADAPTWRLLLGRGFVLFCLAALLGRMAMMSYYHFYTLFLQANFPDAPQGILWALGPLSEIPVIFFSLAIMKRIGVRNLFIIGLAGVTVRLLGFSVVRETWQLYPLQVLHALTFGAVHAASVTYIGRLLPANLQGTGQTVFAGVTMGVGGIVGGALGGILRDTWGFHGLYAVFSGIAAAGLILALLAVPDDRQPAA